MVTMVSLVTMFLLYQVAAATATMIADRYIEAIRAMYENKTHAVKVGSEVSTSIGVESGVR